MCPKIESRAWFLPHPLLPLAALAFVTPFSDAMQHADFQTLSILGYAKTFEQLPPLT